MREPAESRVCRLPLTAGCSQVVVALARPGTGPRWQEASTCLPTPVTVRLPARRPPLPRTCRPPAEDSEPPGWRRLLSRSYPHGNFQWNSLKTNEWTVPWFWVLATCVLVPWAQSGWVAGTLSWAGQPTRFLVLRSDLLHMPVMLAFYGTQKALAVILESGCLPYLNLGGLSKQAGGTRWSPCEWSS